MAPPARVGSSSSQKKGSSKAPPPPPARPGRFYAIIGFLVLVAGMVLFYLARRPKDVSIPVKATIEAADTAGFRGYVLGSDSAKVEITEYADFQCPACQSFDLLQFDVIKRQLIDSGLVRWRYRDFPLDQIHRYARLASHAAACADEQGKFWSMHRALYENQSTWASSGSAGELFADYAKRIGLDGARYESCMSSAKYAGRIQASLQEGMNLGVPSTPTFLIGGRLYPGVLSSDSVAAMARRVAGQPTQ